MASLILTSIALLAMTPAAHADCVTDLNALKTESAFKSNPDAGISTADELITMICANKDARKSSLEIKNCALSVKDIKGVHLSHTLDACSHLSVRSDLVAYGACVKTYLDKYASTNKTLEFYAPPCNTKEERAAIAGTIECIETYFSGESETLKKVAVNGIAKEFFSKCRNRNFRSQRHRIFSCLSLHNGESSEDILPEDIAGYYKACHIVVR